MPKFNSDNSLLVRYVDDFLLISTDLRIARDFVSCMHTGFPDHGCEINFDKTLTNFEMETGGMNLTCVGIEKEFPWCGLLICQKSLDVKSDYSRMHDTRFSLLDIDSQNTLSINFAGRIGENLINKIVQYLKSKLHPIFLDERINSRRSTILNIYQGCLLCATKFVSYCSSAFPKLAMINMGFLERAIVEIIQRGYGAYKSQAVSLKGSATYTMKVSEYILY